MNDTDTSYSESNEPQIIDRKFTLTEDIDEKIRTMAKQHYGGNNSQCVRSAVEDHKRTRNGMGERLLRRIEDDIADVRETVDQIEQSLDDSARAENPTEKDRVEAAVENDNTMSSSSLTEEMLSVYRQIADEYPDFQTVDEIVAGDLPADDVQRALVNLEDGGYVKSSKKDGQIEYKMIGTNN